jgi:hypothetical protein
VFEGLLPKKEDRIVRKLLFELATWHGLAKLRLHTETTVTDLENSATRLGHLRKFKSDVCSVYATRDLPSEEAAHGRRKAAKEAKVGKKPETPAASTGKKKKKPKLRGFTYKLHGLPDYPAAIRAQRTQVPRMYVICDSSKMFIHIICP